MTIKTCTHQEQIGKYQGFGYATELSYNSYLVDTVNGCGLYYNSCVLVDDIFFTY